MFAMFRAISLLSCGHLLGKFRPVMLNCEVVTFPFGILGQVWYLIVSVPDLCPLFLLSYCTHCATYFDFSGPVTRS